MSVSGTQNSFEMVSAVKCYDVRSHKPGCGRVHFWVILTAPDRCVRIGSDDVKYSYYSEERAKEKRFWLRPFLLSENFAKKFCELADLSLSRKECWERFSKFYGQGGNVKAITTSVTILRNRQSVIVGIFYREPILMHYFQVMGEHGEVDWIRYNPSHQKVEYKQPPTFDENYVEKGEEKKIEACMFSREAVDILSELASINKHETEIQQWLKDEKAFDYMPS